jgi:hypothetical protein
MRTPRKAPRHRLVSLIAVVAAVAAIAPQGALAQTVVPKKGRYAGSTKQADVTKSARGIEFQVKGRKISLTKEPVIARGFCTSTPVFLLDVEKVTVKLSRKGSFSFESTFIGTKIDRISGQFDANGNIEGTIVYHFRSSDTEVCTEGKATTTFSAKPRKKK